MLKQLVPLLVLLEWTFNLVRLLGCGIDDGIFDVLWQGAQLKFQCFLFALACELGHQLRLLLLQLFFHFVLFFLA
jgi:hypothetical protein